jgi:hypothetical protein
MKLWRRDIHAIKDDRTTEPATPRPFTVTVAGRARPGSTPAEMEAGRDLDAATTRVISAAGDMRNGAAIQQLQSCCVGVIHHGRRRVVLDLHAVQDSDTKLVAGLVFALRRARAACVTHEVHASHRLWEWISLCNVSKLLESAPPAQRVERAAPARIAGARNG